MNVAIILALKGWESAQKFAYLVSLSTTTMMTLFPSDLGRPVIKSIETSSQRWLGMTNGCRRPGFLVVLTLFCWQTKYSTTNLWISNLRPSQKKILLDPMVSFKILNYLLEERCAIPKEPFVWVGSSYIDISDTCAIENHFSC